MKTTKLLSPIYAKKDYGFFTLSANQTTNLTAGEEIRFDTSEGNIALSGYQMTLKANVRYKLQASLTSFSTTSNNNFIKYVWYDTTNSAEIGIDGYRIGTSYSTTAESPQSTAFGVICPETDIVVELRVVSNTNCDRINSGESYAYIESMESVIPVTQERERCFAYLTAQDTTALSSAGTYYKISGTFAGNTLNKNFTVDATGKITYNGASGVFNLVGVSDVEVDKACKITYALYKNGVIVSGATTPHDFGSASKTENISITTFVNPSDTDYYEVYAKSDTTTTTLTVSTLLLTFTVA